MKSRYISLALFLLGLSACANKFKTADLYLQSSRPMIYLTSEEEDRAKQGMLQERLSYQHKIDTLQPEKSKEEQPEDGKMRSYELEEFVVTSSRPKIKISTIRNGEISLRFLISVPKTFAREDLRLSFYPKLYSGDSLIKLPALVMQGKAFRAAQEKEYAQFKEQEALVVNPSKYDSLYFDKKKHASEMHKLETKYLKAYAWRYHLQKDYDRWRNVMEQRYTIYNAENMGRQEQRYHQKALKLLEKAYDANLRGEDSTQLMAAYKVLMQPEEKKKFLNANMRTITEKNVPSRFRQIFLSQGRMENIDAKTVTEKDSTLFAEHSYDFRAIARNEERIKNMSTYEDLMIGLKKIPNAKEVLPLEEGKDILYTYEEQIKVTPQLAKKLKLTMESDVFATDRSSWRQADLDTLIFVVTGLNDLADPSLAEVYKENPTYYSDYKAGLERLAVRDYEGALTILRYYPDYNAAIGLVGLGMNDKALELLEKLPETGKSLYLKAIVLSRLNRLPEAKTTLRHAVEKESFLGYKAETEPEFAHLMQDEAFREELIALADGY